MGTSQPKYDKNPENTYSRQKAANWHKPTSPGGQFPAPAVDDADR
jgi:hypothetical protein